ncbi:MAG TPA: MXAN_2755 family glutamic-type intramembrane protease [Anaeromyxobacteraceae bacterium]|nr:MXAN_2755 family glutamic-type intramembrane protease [Anaeromyxobacteraceae bacterium]
MSDTGRAPPPPPPLAPGRLVRTWALALGALAVAKGISLGVPLVAANLAGIAALLFVLVPDRIVRARDEYWDSYGLEWWGPGDARTWRAWGRGALWALGLAAVVFPVFALGYRAFAEVLPSLPTPLARALAPYVGAPRFSLRAPPDLGLRVAAQLLVVALPEELFYRGFLQTAWGRVPGRGRRVLGAELRPGFLRTQALFALGHLVVLQPWRLGTFFPGLLFGWLRARTGGLAAPVLFHALSNLLMQTLEASFYGG